MAVRPLVLQGLVAVVLLVVDRLQETILLVVVRPLGCLHPVIRRLLSVVAYTVADSRRVYFPRLGTLHLLHLDLLLDLLLDLPLGILLSLFLRVVSRKVAYLVVLLEGSILR